jgi:hypothetical protein
MEATPGTTAPPRDVVALDSQSHTEIDEYGLNAGIIVVVEGGDQWKLIANSTG